MSRIGILCMLVLSILLSGCKENKPYEPIMYSQDACHHCKMLINDKRFGAEIVTSKGKKFKFDAIECMLNHLKKNPELGGGIYVTDSFAPETMIEFQKAFYYHDPAIRSPMGKGIFATQSQLTINQKTGNTREILKWQDVLKLTGQSTLEKLF